MDVQPKPHIPSQYMCPGGNVCMYKETVTKQYGYGNLVIEWVEVLHNQQQVTHTTYILHAERHLQHSAVEW